MKPGPWKPGPLVITLNQGGSNIKPKRNQEQTPRPDPGIQFHWKMNEINTYLG